jgi:hypothetical protein
MEFPMLCSSTNVRLTEVCVGGRRWIEEARLRLSAHRPAPAATPVDREEQGCGFLRTALRRLLPLRQRLPLPPLNKCLSLSQRRGR